MKSIEIAVVGFGFAGVSTTIRLLSWIPKGSQITIFEKCSLNNAGGLAYNENLTTTRHFLNLQAGRISLFREKRNDFIKWANDDADRKTWPDELCKLKNLKFKFIRSTPVPRILYQKYLKDRFDVAVEFAKKDIVSVVIKNEEISSITHEEKIIVTSTSEKEERPFIQEFDYVILCTGNLIQKIPPKLLPLKDDERVIIDQFSVEARKKLLNLPTTADILILGTGMRSYDVMIDLNKSIKSNIYHEGHIYYCSRNGLFHQSYSKNHIHEIISIPRPSFLDKKHLTKEVVIEAIKLEFSFQCSMLSDIPENIRAERIIKGWEKWVPELVKALTPEDIKELQDEYWSLITTLRIGVINEITNIVKKFENEQKSTVLKGELHTVEGQPEKIKVNINNKKEGSSKEIYVDIIINCLGRETDYNKIGNTLWKQLIENGMAVPHKMTGRGVETTWLGTVIDKTSNPISSIMAVGVMRDGDETQRNGRLGSFVFSIGPIRNNALQTATSILLKEQLGKNVTNKIENACEQKGDAEALRCVVGDTVDETTLAQLVKSFDGWVALCISSLDPSQARLKSKKQLKESITSEIACITQTTQLVRSIVYGCAMLFAVREICDIQQVTTEFIEEDIKD